MSPQSSHTPRSPLSHCSELDGNPEESPPHSGTPHPEYQQAVDNPQTANRPVTSGSPLTSGSTRTPGKPLMSDSPQMYNNQPIHHYSPPHGHPYMESYHHPPTRYQAPGSASPYSRSASPYLRTSIPGTASTGPHFNVPLSNTESSNPLTPQYPLPNYQGIDTRHFTRTPTPTNNPARPHVPPTSNTAHGEPNKNTQSPHTGMPATPPMSHTTSPAHSPPGPPLPTPTTPPTHDQEPEIIIAVIGVTGTGKSYFIKEVSGIPDVEVSSSLHSCTARVQPYSFPYAGAKITLVDTPGFNDTTRSDTEVLKDICAWTSLNYREKKLLSGIIYLHRITDVRMDGSSLRTLRMFERLCGPSALENVLLTTTQWAGVDEGLGESREGDLKHGDFWGGLIAKGASLERFLSTRESGLELIQKLMMKEERKPLYIQKQIVEKDMALVDTAAGKFMNEELISLEKKYQERLERLKTDHEEAMKQKDSEMKDILAQERQAAQEKLEKAAAERKFLRDLHAAEMKKFEDAERKREEERERNGRIVIAVKAKDISSATILLSIFRSSRIKGRFIHDIDDAREFRKDPLDIKIHYQSNIFVPTPRSPNATAEAPNRGVYANHYLTYNGAVYLTKTGDSIKIAFRKFVIFRKL